MTETIRPIVTKALIAVTATTSVREALAVMEEHRFRHLPVTDPKSGSIVGMVSRQTLEAHAVDPQLPVLGALSLPFVVVNESDSLRHVIMRLLEMKVSGVLVVDAQDHAVGIVTTDDILWHYATALSADDSSVKPLLSFANLQFAGVVAHQLSSAGI